MSHTVGSPSSKATLTGWGCTPLVMTRVSSPKEEQIASNISRSRHVIPRGLGRSYGDSAICANGETLLSESLDSLGAISDGQIIVGAGVSIDSILKMVVPQGWFIPVTPGTRFVTVGGAIAADVHGKNHHHDGSFGAYVDWLELILADGQSIRVSPDHYSELFWSTVGGMGLTGMITRAAIRLLPIQSSQMKVLTTRHSDLDDLMATMIERDKTHRYTVAWVDTLASGSNLGRSILMAGDHADVDALPMRSHKSSLAYDPKVRLAVPVWANLKLVKQSTIRPFNELWYRKSPRKAMTSFESITKFFHPLDGVKEWNRLYGDLGFVQYQFVVPDTQSELVREFIRRLSDGRFPAFLSVLKRFGGSGQGWMSFPMPGWTLAVDIPSDSSGLGPMLDAFDERVAAAGGRVYLAKDSRMHWGMVARMYPRLDDFRRLRSEVDPRGVFSSHQSRRLGL